jgi:hypothetical protein
MLSLSCYNLACHYFLHLLSTLCTHLSYFLFLLLCSAAQKMKSSLIKTSSRCAGPSHVFVAWRPLLMFSPKGFVIIFDVINTGYNVYFTICHFICET